MVKVGDIIAEIEVEDGGEHLLVVVGGLGELNFHTDSIGGVPRIWDTLIGTKEALKAILEYLENNPNHIKPEDLEQPDELKDDHEAEWNEDLHF